MLENREHWFQRKRILKARITNSQSLDERFQSPPLFKTLRASQERPRKVPGQRSEAFPMPVYSGSSPACTASARSPSHSSTQPPPHALSLAPSLPGLVVSLSFSIACRSYSLVCIPARSRPILRRGEAPPDNRQPSHHSNHSALADHRGGRGE